MRKILISFFTFLIIAAFSFHIAYGQSNLLPKYGSMPKNEAQLAADKELLARN